MEFEFIKGYENLYKINKNGDIFSCKYNKIMVNQTTEDGYLWVKLCKPLCIENNKIKHKTHKGRIHRLLAIQYLDNPENLPEVDHIDRNKNNNNLENLRWVSRITNRRNRADYHENLSDEQKEERKKKLRDYKAKWARENRIKQQNI